MLKRAAMLLTVLIQAVLLASLSYAGSQPAHPLSLTPFVGGYTFDGSQRLSTKPVYGLRAGYDINERWTVEGLFDYVATKSRVGLGDASSYNYRVEGLYNLMPGNRVSPFLAAGLGGNTIDFSGATKGSTNPSLDYGAGVKYLVSDAWALRGDIRNVLVFDSIDKVWSNLEYTIGLSYLFGGPAAVAKPEPEADSDGDGVPDSRDKCPDTPKDAAVDGSGCPLDSDADGVPDYLDKCPDTPKGASVDKNGCPLDTDADGDGVLDSADKCPDTPKGVTVDKDGCPLDSDADGVPDYLDKCPDTPSGAPVDKDGCPLDSDGDGVPDYLDKCPDTPKGVSVDKNGCPPVIEKKSMRLNIEFDTGRADIKAKYHDEIKKVADLMKQYPDIDMAIEGHTDNVGSEKYNTQLSRRRAESVKKYLSEKFGIAPGRLTAAGYGSSRPIADNSTPEGRQKNRRIEAVINYTVTK